MGHLKFAYLLIGIAILALVAGEIELEEVAALVIQVGWGFAVVIGVYFLAFVIDSFSWQLALTGVPLDAVWLYRMWKVRMVGEVFNSVLPAAGMGGEPVKAVLLNKHYGVGFRESTASLILAKTINLIALVAFLAAGFILMAYSPALPGSFKSVAALGLGALALGILLLFAVQKLKITSLTGSWIGRRRLGQRLEDLLHHVRDMDDRLAGFYSGHGVRFAGAVGLALINWLLGAVEIYVTMIFLRPAHIVGGRLDHRIRGPTGAGGHLFHPGQHRRPGGHFPAGLRGDDRVSHAGGGRRGGPAAARGHLLAALSFSHISGRPRHPKQDERVIEAFKKTSRARWRLT